MNKLYIFLTIFSISVCSFTLPQNYKNQIAIGGVINSYGAVSNIMPGTNCENILTVDDATGFLVGEEAWVIQMQGAEINETNSGAFGDVINLNSAGLFEKVTINAIDGNQITISALINNYQISGKVQIVSFPQFVDAEVNSDLIPMPWNGSKGGIISLNVTGTLTLNANINASKSGFGGGTRSNPSSNCFSFIQSPDYYYNQNSFESEGKGQGIAAIITGKEYGRGAQANGGGGGNDHNAGGGGGAGYAKGGNGGENDEPSLGGCRGVNPGIGGKSISFTDQRLFFGGGGGAGSDNNNAGTDGGIGGGIIIITANVIEGNNDTISVNGESLEITPGLDGGGGGGGGGAIILNATTINSSFVLLAEGGNGSNTDNKNNNRCMGPGGGGGGGAIYTNNQANIITSVTGGLSGIVELSSASCNGSTNNGQAGSIGLIAPAIDIPENPGTTTGVESYNGCQGDGYMVMVNNTSYNQNNPTGTEMLINTTGCDSIVTIDLMFDAVSSSTVNPTICIGDEFEYEGEIYNINNDSGQFIIPGGSTNNCDSVVNIALSFYPEMTITETAASNDVMINVTGGTAPFVYNWSNGLTGELNTLTASGSYTVSVTDANNCQQEHTFNFMTTSNEEIESDYGINIFPSPVLDQLTIECNVENSKWNVSLKDVAGKEVLSKIGIEKQMQINLSHLAEGVYILQIHSDEFIYSKKIIKSN